MSADAEISRQLEPIYDYLAEFHIDRAVVEYSGSGDSGEVESVDYFAAENEALDEERIKGMTKRFSIKRSVWDSEANEYKNANSMVPVHLKIEEILCELLPGGWEINEGSQGDFTIYPTQRKAILQHGTNYNSTEEEIWEY